MLKLIKNLFRPHTTAIDMAAALQKELAGFRVTTIAPDELVIQAGEYLLVDILLVRGGGEAFVTFAADIQPNLAANIALLVNDMVPAYTDTQFMFNAMPVKKANNETIIN